LESTGVPAETEKRMRKTMCFVMFLLVVVLAGGCAPKYSEVRIICDTFIKETNAYTDAIQGENDSRKAIDLTEAYLLKKGDFYKYMDAIGEKYPELSQPNLPADMSDIQERYAQAMKRMRAALKNKLQSTNDEELERVLRRLL